MITSPLSHLVLCIGSEFEAYEFEYQFVQIRALINAATNERLISVNTFFNSLPDCFGIGMEEMSNALMQPNVTKYRHDQQNELYVNSYGLIRLLKDSSKPELATAFATMLAYQLSTL